MRAFVRGMIRGVFLMAAPFVASMEWAMDPHYRSWWHHYVANYRWALKGFRAPDLRPAQRPVSHESDEP